MSNLVIAIDPGREKCGIAVVSVSLQVFYQAVIAADRLLAVVEKLAQDYQTELAVIGDRTFSRETIEKLRAVQQAGVIREIIPVDEHRSTDMARQRYWRDNPPQGWHRFLPVSLQVPARPVDDYVAVILAERYFGNKQKS